MVSITLDFSLPQEQGAALPLARRAGLTNAVDAARAFLRGCGVHLHRAVQRLPVDREGADEDLNRRLVAAPTGVATLAETKERLTTLRSHTNKQVRDWTAWADRDIIRYMIFPRIYSRMHPDLLVAVPANTNVPESRHHANLTRCPPGQLLQVISRHETMDTQAMTKCYARGSGGSEKSRPLNDEKRYARQADRSHNARAKANDRMKAAGSTITIDDRTMPTKTEPADDHTASIANPETQTMDAEPHDET